MRDSVEAGADILLENPLRSVISTECDETGFDRICRRTPSPNSYGVRVSRRFRDRVKCQQVEGLHSPISHGRNREGSLSTIALGNISSRVSGEDGLLAL